VSVSVPLEGVEAKLNMASQAPTEQSKKAPKMRGLKKADWELIFLRIGVGRLDNRHGDFVVRASRHKWMLLMRELADRASLILIR
jgi:hypothetical protein